MVKVALVVGTRPEGIKMGPLLHALKKRGDIESTLVATAQHREQLDVALDAVATPPDIDLDLMERNQGWTGFLSRALPTLREALHRVAPDWVVVQGDTVSALAGGLASTYLGIPLAHVEAGLRTGDTEDPYPEEIHRKLLAQLSSLHLAPTPSSRDNLLSEGISPEDICMTGNTGVDALAMVKPVIPPLPDSPLVLMTLHRQDALPLFREMAEALADVAMAHPHLAFIFPLHPNPKVREALLPPLEPVPNISLLDSLPYPQIVGLLSRVSWIITDSGGLQEEAAAFGVPVAVLRNKTERVEGVRLGIASILGRSATAIRQEIPIFLADDALRKTAGETPNPYGDGQASKRCAQALAWRMGIDTRPADWLAVGFPHVAT